MRFLHTSDWHLGRSFHQVGLLAAQSQFLDHLVEVVRTESVDAVLVSGDVYDRAMPSPDTVRLLSESVTRLVDAGAQVVLSSGNHDSAIRLGFASDLLARAGLHIRSSLASVGTPVVVGGVAVYPLPYLEPSVAAEPLGVSDRTHAGVLGAAMARVRDDLAARGLRGVVMAHAFVTGGATSDSERDISVGGVSAVHPSVFDGFAYAALGHLHGRQQVGETVRYSGSPVALSFSESGHTKGSWLVDLDAATGAVAVEQVEAPVHRELAVLRGDLDDLLLDPRLTPAERAWCQVTLTDPVRPLGAMEQLRRRFPHTLVLQFDPQGAAVPVRSYTERTAAEDPVDVCCDFLGHVRAGAVASGAERALLAQAVEAVRLDRGVREDEGRADTGGRGTAGTSPGSDAADAAAARHDVGAA
ncbi:exonuclease SbcCD subunit D [Phycicoccus ginsengisoli]